jgi:hypothetical protein
VAVLHDWRCAAHGEFEAFGSTEDPPKCPKGCSKHFVRLIFKKPPGIKSNGTKVADASLRALAADFGLTNIGSNGGESVRDYVRRGQSMDPNTKEMNFAPLWHGVPHAAPGFSQQTNPNVPTVDPSAALGGSTVQGENAVSRTFGQSEEGRITSIPAPRPVIPRGHSYRPDPSDWPDAPPA